MGKSDNLLTPEDAFGVTVPEALYHSLRPWCDTLMVSSTMGFCFRSRSAYLHGRLPDLTAVIAGEGDSPASVDRPDDVVCVTAVLRLVDQVFKTLVEITSPGRN